MGKVIASYLVRVTLRERDEAAGEAAADPIKSEPLTIAEIERHITEMLDSWDDYLTANVSAERTDR